MHINMRVCERAHPHTHTCTHTHTHTFRSVFVYDNICVYCYLSLPSVSACLPAHLSLSLITSNQYGIELKGKVVLVCVCVYVCVYIYIYASPSRSPSPRLCPSTAGCSPPSVPSIVLCHLLFSSRWFPPSLLCHPAIFCLIIPFISSLALVSCLCSV